MAPSVYSGLGIDFDEQVKFDVWTDITEVYGFKERVSLLMGNKIEIPFAWIAGDSTLRDIYAESVKAYLYGLPNSSIPMTLRFLQLICRDEFRQATGKSDESPPLEDLINWTEKRLNEKTTAHGFQILRNLVHTEALLKDQDALEAIRHISIIANKLRYFDKATVKIYCNFCQIKHEYGISPNEYILGKEIWFKPCEKRRYSFTKKINL